MQVVADKALLLTLKDPQRVLTTVSNSKPVDKNKVLVKWDVPEVHTLRDIGIEAPSPISRRYKWTGRYTPFDHQKTTAEFLTLHKRAFCFNEQGTGKTASAIWAADFLMARGLVNRVLVLCPLSIMDSAWRNDLFNFAMHRTVEVAYGTPAKRRKILAQNTEFVIINYDGVNVVEKEIAEGGFDLIIVDEATHYKTATTKRWKTLKRLVNEDTWLWLMTGTPAAQSPTDAYGLAKLVNPTNVSRTFTGFRDRVMIQQRRFVWEPRPEATDIVHKVLQPAIRFSKEECLDLPEMTYTHRHVELTKQQKTYYEKLRKEMILQASDEQVTSVNAAINMNKLLQISAGAVYTDDKNVLEFDIAERYKVLKESVDESSHKVLVFVPFRHTIEIVAEKLRADGYPTEIIDGSVPAHKRTAIFDDFQTKKAPRVLVIQPQAAAHGVTLTAANTVVWWGPTSSLETYAQANARVHRSGQKNPSTVVHLSGSPVERKIFKMLTQRVDIHTKLLSLYKDLLD